MRKIDYIFCLPGENYKSTFLHSWTMSVIELMKRSEDFIFVNYYSPIVSYTRNQLIRCIPGEKTSDEISLPFGGEIEAKKIIFIDDDIVWNPEDLIKIIESKEDIVSGFYKMAITDEYNNNSKLAAIESGRLLNIGQIKNKKQLIELDSVGLGFVAINFEVFKKIQYPWFETFDFIDKKNNKTSYIGEDVSFCNKAKDAGYKIYGDPTVKVGHHKTKVLDFKNE